MAICPSCGSSNCHTEVSHHHHHMHHPPHMPPGGSLIGGLIVAGIAGALLLAGKAMDDAEKKKKFHLVNYVCGKCHYNFRDWNVTETAVIDWTVKNSTYSTLHLEFYSTDRKGHVWPGENKVWVLNSGSSHTYSIRGLKGEKICYGAWRKSGGGSWGVGKGGENGCTGCCYTLDASGLSGYNNLVD